ncbi:MAG: Tad domain-containing protein [Mycobacteriales bacterium]
MRFGRLGCGRCVVRGDGGSMLPMIAVFVLIVVLMLMGVFAATGAFIAQRDLQSVCDETAAAVASEANTDQPRSRLPDGSEVLSLDAEAVAVAVEAWRVEFYSDDPGLQMVGTSEGGVAVVRCHTKVKVPFGAVFGKGGGVDRDAVSVVRSPVRKPKPEASIVPDDPRGEYGN